MDGTTTTPNDGRAVRAWRWLWGQRRKRLTEQEGRMSVSSLLLTISQSIALVLVFGHAEIPWLLSGNPGARLVAVASLSILIITAVAADTTMLKSLRRMSILRRNRQMGMWWEHFCYVGFVVGIEAVTFMTAIYVLDQDPAKLLSPEPLLPAVAIILFVQVGLRAALTAWTYIQSQLVAQKLPPVWETGMALGRELVGGHANEILESLHLENRDIAAVMNAFAQMSKKPKRRPTRWNAKARARDEQYEQELEQERQHVVHALQGLSRNHDDELRAQFTEELRQVSARHAAEIDGWKAQVSRLQAVVEATRNDAATTIEQTLYRAWMSVASTGQLPDDLLEKFPLFRDISLRNVRAKPADKAPQSSTDRHELFLRELGITPAKRPGNRKGLWVKSTDIGRLISGQIKPQSLLDVVKNAGDGETDGRAYIAPIGPLMEELFTRHWVSDEARILWQQHVEPAGNVPAIGRVIPLHRAEDSTIQSAQIG